MDSRSELFMTMELLSWDLLKEIDYGGRIIL